MHPVLIKIGPLVIHTYGVFIAAAFLVAMAWSMREARQNGLNPSLMQDIGFHTLVGAIVGSRALYVLINLGYFMAHPLEILMFWKGGLVFLGGAILGAALDLWVLRRHDQRVMPWLDTVAPGLALGQAVGRLGCLSAGCCYGQTCDLPWAITFTDPKSLAPLFVSLHPTQLYHVLAGLTTFTVLLIAKRRITGQGRLMGLFLVLYACFRFTIEFFRGDYRGDFGFLSVTQVLAMGFLAIGLWLMLRKAKPKSAYKTSSENRE